MATRHLVDIEPTPFNPRFARTRNSRMSDYPEPDPEIADAAAHVARMNMLARVGFLIALVVLGLFVYQFHGPLSKDPQDWGQFGDYLGGILNPTFSFLALLALLATLGLQIRELRISARELKNSATALVKQNETLGLQTFESTFFQLLRLHNDIVASLEIGNLRGRACFGHYLGLLEGTLLNEGATTNVEAFRTYYEIFYQQSQATLGHYFRLLYNIVKLVKRTDGIDKRFYTNLVRAQLSSDELKLLFYNCISELGSEKFKPLIEEFALLKNFPNDSVPRDPLLHMYPPEAFGGSYPESYL